MTNFKQARPADKLKLELIKLFNSFRLASNASSKDEKELAATRNLLKARTIPGKNADEQLSQACYQIALTLKGIPSLNTQENKDLVNAFALKMGLGEYLSYRPF